MTQRKLINKTPIEKSNRIIKTPLSTQQSSLFIQLQPNKIQSSSHQNTQFHQPTFPHFSIHSQLVHPFETTLNSSELKDLQTEMKDFKKMKEKRNHIEKKQFQTYTNSSHDSSSTEYHQVKEHQRKKQYLQSKNELRDFETIQQSILLALLNEHCEFTLELPSKLSTVTLTNPRIITITINDQQINLKKLSEQMYCQSYADDLQSGIKEETCVRMFEKKKRIFINYFLIDLCIEFGYLFDSKYSRKSKQTMQLERIQRIFYHNQLKMEKDEIIKKGKSITKYLFGLVNSNNIVTIQKNHPMLSKLLNNSLKTPLMNVKTK